MRACSFAGTSAGHLERPSKSQCLLPPAFELYNISKTTPSVGGFPPPQTCKYLRFLSLVGIGADWQYGKSIRSTLAGHHNKVVYIPLFGQGFESAWCRALLLCAARYMYAMPCIFYALFPIGDRHGKITICIRSSSLSSLL